MEYFASNTKINKKTKKSQLFLHSSQYEKMFKEQVELVCQTVNKRIVEKFCK